MAIFCFDGPWCSKLSILRFLPESDLSNDEWSVAWNGCDSCCVMSEWWLCCRGIIGHVGSCVGGRFGILLDICGGRGMIGFVLDDGFDCVDSIVFVFDLFRQVPFCLPVWVNTLAGSSAAICCFGALCLDRLSLGIVDGVSSVLLGKLTLFRFFDIVIPSIFRRSVD